MYWKTSTRLRFEVFSLEKVRTLDYVSVPHSNWDRVKCGSYVGGLIPQPQGSLYIKSQPTNMSRTVLKVFGWWCMVVVGGGWWWWLRPILVLSLTLDQAEQSMKMKNIIKNAYHSFLSNPFELSNMTAKSKIESRLDL